MAVEKVVIAVAAAMFGGPAVLPLAGTAPGDAPPPATATGLDSPADSAADHSAVNHYVALGDSYTSGPLVPEQRPEIPGCARSTGNYPSLLAQRLDVAEFTDVSCGGASTEHMTAPQEVDGGPNPPQLDALRADTDLVTLGIGGNDHNVFGRFITTCPPLREQDPAGAPCREQFTVDGVDTLVRDATGTGHRIATVLEEIHRRSPDARVVVMGYPRLVPEQGTCPDVMPFADGDLRWWDDVETALNTAIEKAVSADGKATFVDMYPSSRGHDACAWDAAWIQGQHDDPEAAARYHPRPSGMTGMADAAARAIG